MTEGRHLVRLKPYPEYRNSGLPWLGRIPAHREVRWRKALEKTGRPGDRRLPALLPLCLS
jgi:hypothetical protein